MNSEKVRTETIARQSQMKVVYDILNANQVKHINFTDVVAITNVMVDYTVNGYTKEIGDRLRNIDEYIKTLK